MTPDKQWDGCDIPEGETDDTSILIWVVDPSLQCDYGETWIRGWQRMLEWVGGNLECHMEQFDKEELIEHGVRLDIRLRRVSLGLYREVCEQEDY